MSLWSPWKARNHSFISISSSGHRHFSPWLLQKLLKCCPNPSRSVTCSDMHTAARGRWEAPALTLPSRIDWLQGNCQLLRIAHPFFSELQWFSLCPLPQLERGGIFPKKVTQVIFFQWSGVRSTVCGLYTL